MSGDVMRFINIKNIKKISALLFAVIMTFSLVSCGYSKDSSKTDASERDSADAEENPDEDVSSSATSYHSNISVGISMPDRDLERWQRDGTFLKKQFESKGYSVELTFADNSFEKQINDLQKMIDDRVNLILVVAADANSLSAVLDNAKDNKIPVVAYDRLILNTDAISYYVSFDNYTVGTLQAQYVVEALGLNENQGPFNIEFTAGDPGDNNAAFFYNGARDFLKTYIDSGKINVISGQDEFAKVVTDSWSTEKAEKRFKNIIKSYYSDG